MSVTYSETGSNYTYLDANILPVDYDSSKPHIRRLAYYISQKTPSKKTRIVDVRVARSSYIDAQSQMGVAFIVGKTTASSFTSADFVHTNNGTVIKNLTPFASSKNLSPFISPINNGTPATVEYYSWGFDDNIYLPKIILKEGESLAIIEVQNEFKNILISNVNKYDIPHPNNVSTISIMGFEEDTTIDLVTGEEITGDNIGEGLDYTIDNNHPWGIGEFWPAQGGYYGGKYVVGNDIRAIIVSPKEEGELKLTSNIGVVENTKHYRLTTNIPNSFSSDGDMLDSEPVRSSNLSAAKGALSIFLSKPINGKVDWRVGSYFELLTIFNNLNPGINLDRPEYNLEYLEATEVQYSGYGGVTRYNEDSVTGPSRWRGSYTRFIPKYKSNHNHPNTNYHSQDNLYIGINPYSIPPRTTAIRPPKYDALEDNKNFYKKTKAKNFQGMAAQSLYSSDSLYLTTSILKQNSLADWQLVEGQMCISPCYSDYQTIEAFNITGSPWYETGFNISYSSSTLAGGTPVTANVYSHNGLPGPGIIIRLIRTVVIGQITP